MIIVVRLAPGRPAIHVTSQVAVMKLSANWLVSPYQ